MMLLHEFCCSDFANNVAISTYSQTAIHDLKNEDSYESSLQRIIDNLPLFR